MNPTGIEETTRIDLSHVDRIVDGYDGDKSWLVMILQDVQTVYNYLPRPALERVAERLELHISHVYRVATFYASFALEERGKHLILACDGTACHLRGSTNILEELRRQLKIEPGQTTPDRMFTLETVACLGACALAPVMTVGSDYHGLMTPDKIKQILNEHRNLASVEEKA